MTMPRKEQIKSVNTRFASFTLDVIPGTLSTAITTGTLNPFVITDVPGGSQESAQATVLGTVSEPFTIVPGDSINVNRDGAGSVLVTFLAQDTTASKVAARINAALATTALNESGRVRISSTGFGATATVVLSDGVAGTLTKLGLTAGTFTGVDAAVRGVVTRTRDNLGGYVKMKGQDGKSFVADNPSIRPYETSGGVTSYVAELPNGAPVHGRLSFDGTNYQLKSFASVPSHAQTITGDSRFDLLDGTDNFSITVDGGVWVVNNITFPSPPYTVSQVADRINERYAAVAEGVDGGRATIVGTISQPFTFNGTLSFRVDGGGLVNVPINVTSATAAAVAAIIQAGVAGTTCDTITSGSSIFLRIRSNNLNGRTSSIDIRPTGAQNQFVLDKLGISAGLYRGRYIAELYGTQAIRLVSPQRGSLSSLFLSGVAQTLTRMGLVGGTYNGSNRSTEEPVGFPNPTWTPGGVAQVTCLIPESLEFGEVPSASEAFVLEGLDTSDGANQNTPSSIFLSANAQQRYRGLSEAGKPVILGPDGLVDPSVMRLGTDPIFNVLKRVVEGDPQGGTVTGLITNSIAGTGAAGSPVAASPDMVIDLDPSNAQAANPRQLSVRFGRDVAPVIPFIFGNNPLVPNGPNVPYTIRMSLTGSAIYQTAGSIMFTDANVVTALTAEGNSPRIVPLSGSANGDGFIRVNDVLARPGVYAAASLLRKVNAAWTVTVGDGTLSFGDFSGTNAIQQAVAFFNTNGGAFSSLTIHVKQGFYEVNAGNGTIVGPSGNRPMHIEGLTDPGGTANIAKTDNTTVLSVAGPLVIKNLSFSQSNGSYGILNANSSLELNRVSCTGIRIICGSSFKLIQCNIQSSGTADGPLLTNIFAASGTVAASLVRDTKMNTATDFPIFRVESRDVIPGIANVEYLWDNCELTVGQSTITTGNLTGNAGVLDLLPNSTNPGPGGTATGIKIRKISYENCKVRGVFSATASPLLHVTTKTNADNTAGTLGRIHITKFEINGGSWLAFRANSSINPFTLVGIGEDDFLNPPNEEVGGIVLRDVVFGFSYNGSLVGITQGAATNDIANEFGGSTVPAVNHWGAFVFGARIIDANGVQYVGGSQGSDSGDMVFRWDRANLRNFAFSRYTAAGGGASPNQRVRFRPYSPLSVSLDVDNWSFTGTGSSILGLSTHGFLFPEPNSLARSQAAGTQMTFNNLQIQSFGSTGCAVFLDGDLTSGALYTSSPNHYRNIVFSNCKISSLDHGFRYISSTNGNFMSNVRFLNNYISDMDGEGISIQAASTTQTQWDTITCIGNTIRDCDSIGIYIVADVWVTGTPPASVIIVNNTLQNNSGSESGLQIKTGFLGLNAVTLQNPHGVIHGNICGLVTGSAEGYIQCFRSDGAGAITALANAVPSVTFVRGLETHYDATVSAALTNFRIFNDNSACLHNAARLDNSP